MQSKKYAISNRKDPFTVKFKKRIPPNGQPTVNKGLANNSIDQ